MKAAGSIGWLPADWPAPSHVRAGTTLRTGGVSEPPYHSLNLATHVGDLPQRVAENRARLRAGLALPGEPWWLAQCHGTRVASWGEADARADGACCSATGQVLAVLTADCLPVVLCDRAGSELAVLHAGWRGLAAGILEAGLARLRSPPGSVLAWLGPAIGAARYEVGAEVRSAFLEVRPALAPCFTPTRPEHWLADLTGVARALLRDSGVAEVHGGGRCTSQEAGAFFSHRRDGLTGRMATLAWLE